MEGLCRTRGSQEGNDEPRVGTQSAVTGNSVVCKPSMVLVLSQLGRGGFRGIALGNVHKKSRLRGSCNELIVVIHQ